MGYCKLHVDGGINLSQHLLGFKHHNYKTHPFFNFRRRTKQACHLSGQRLKDRKLVKKFPRYILNKYAGGGYLDNIQMNGICNAAGKLGLVEGPALHR